MLGEPEEDIGLNMWQDMYAESKREYEERKSNMWKDNLDFRRKLVEQYKEETMVLFWSMIIFVCGCTFVLFIVALAMNGNMGV